IEEHERLGNFAPSRRARVEWLALEVEDARLSPSALGGCDQRRLEIRMQSSGNDLTIAHQETHVRIIGVVLPGIEHGERPGPALPFADIHRLMVGLAGVMADAETHSFAVESQDRDLGGTTPAV